MAFCWDSTYAEMATSITAKAPPTTAPIGPNAAESPRTPCIPCATLPSVPSSPPAILSMAMIAGIAALADVSFRFERSPSSPPPAPAFPAPGLRFFHPLRVRLSMYASRLRLASSHTSQYRFSAWFSSSCSRAAFLGASTLALIWSSVSYTRPIPRAALSAAAPKSTAMLWASACILSDISAFICSSHLSLSISFLRKSDNVLRASVTPEESNPDPMWMLIFSSITLALLRRIW